MSSENLTQHTDSATINVATHYQGILPPPEILHSLNELVPNGAARIVELVEAESLHRREQEAQAMQANIEAQKQHFISANKQDSAVARNDLFGQISALIVCLSCIASAIYLGINNHDELAGVIAIVPTAALVRSFLLKK